MDQPLDLSIILTPLLQKSTSSAVARITLQCDQLGLAHTGGLLTDPLTAKERESLRWYLEEYWKWPYEGFARRGRDVEALLAEVGQRLYHMVFGGAVAKDLALRWLEYSQQAAPTAQRQISILSDIPKALSLPWELLHDGHGFLVPRLSQPVSIIRRLPQPEPVTGDLVFAPPLRVLLLTARPENVPFIDPRSIARELLDAVQEQLEVGAIEVDFLRPPTLSALRARLRHAPRPVQVLHFDGHGVFDAEAQQGLLAFEDENGDLNLVKAEAMVQALREGGIRLVILTACQGATSAADDALSSAAAQFIHGGIDAVVAMSATVLVNSAARYVAAFYRALADSPSMSSVHERARYALYTDPQRHPHRRRIDEEGQPVALRDWWVPHYYQRRSLALQATPTAPEKLRRPTSPIARLSESMPPEPRYGFSGRARELLRLERWLARGKLVVLHGFGGVGKTSLARETAVWLTRTGMYAEACFVSFEYGGDAAWLLATLGQFLGVYDGLYIPHESRVALARLEPTLKQRPTLVIADNLESILPGGEAPLDGAARTELWNALLQLVQLGAGILLTTRNTVFEDPRLRPGDEVKYRGLKGLHPEDAYLLATRLLTSLNIDRERIPYSELRDLLTQLDHHPLAIQLVLPALQEVPIAAIKADFGVLMPRFADDEATGRHRSLLASLEYSLRRLHEEQQAWLPRLAIFEGGANEDDLLAITAVPENEWTGLRLALRQAGLLTIERIHEDVTVPFLRMHPILIPYLRTLPGSDDPALYERFTQRYYALASLLYLEDDRNAQAARAMARRELPNMRRALQLFLIAGEEEIATEMAISIARFLTIFGRERERDELWLQIGGTITETGARDKEGLSPVEYLHESASGEGEYNRGDAQAAAGRFAALLSRIEALPEGAQLSRGSLEHCQTLHRLAHCLYETGQLDAAEERLGQALAMIVTLIEHPPVHRLLHLYIHERGALLTERGDVFLDQGRYAEAEEAYEEALSVAVQGDDVRQQAVVLEHWGELALVQRDYEEAHARTAEALELAQRLHETGAEAAIWHQLGRIAQEQGGLAEAERCYRKSLEIEERQGNTAGIATTCNQLAIVSMLAGRSMEAEGWLKRALELDEQVQPGGLSHARELNNLAMLLLAEVRAARAPVARLSEARDHAERALAIREVLGPTAALWNELSILADIAELEGQAERALLYRYREHEAFAAFPGNRSLVDRQFAELIASIAAAAKGDSQAREEVEASLPDLEADEWRITEATYNIWAGERDWHHLTEHLSAVEALLVLRILETLEEGV